jgi:tetratricopeptide (TPR) repeat protein
MRKAHLLICPVLLLFCLPSFAQENSRSGSAKQDAPKVIATDDIKLAMEAGKLQTAGKYDEALKLYAQAVDLKGRFTPFVYHNRGMLYLHRAKASQDRQSRIADLQHAIDDFQTSIRLGAAFASSRLALVATFSNPRFSSSLDQCAPEIVKPGTTDVVVDLDQDLEVHGPEANQTEVIWAPDSKRFACNYAPVHAHHTSVEFVAFYQLRDGEWAALHSPSDIKNEDLQLAQLGKGHLLKDFSSRRCAPDNDVLKVRKWTDPNTVILYAPCYQRKSGDLEAGFLFTLKFDDAGKWKIVDTHRMSKKELGAEQ